MQKRLNLFLCSIIYRIPKLCRKSKCQKKDSINSTSGGMGEKTRFRNGGGVDISGPLLTENSQEMTKPKNKTFSETIKVLKPASKPKPPPKVRSAALLLDPEPDIHRKLPSAPDLLRHDPIVKKDSFNKEISKPVLISTTDRRSKAFVRESSNEKLKDANKNVLTPPVPPHAALKPSYSDPPMRPPPRPMSMPPRSEKVKDEKKKLRKSVVEIEQKSPERPPPPPCSSAKPTAQKETVSQVKVTFDPNKRKKEKDKPSFASKTDSSSAVTKFKPEKKISTNAAKSSIELKKTDTVVEAKKGGSAIRLSTELKSKMNRPTPKVRDKQGKSSSTVPEKTSQGQEDSQSSVAAMKAMFDKKESPTIGRSLGNRPSPSPKPGSKVRSVNV